MIQTNGVYEFDGEKNEEMVKKRRKNEKPLDPSMLRPTIDISDILNYGAKFLHKNYKINTFKSVIDINGKFDILYDRCVSSYAFTTAKELADFVNLSNVALMNLFISKEETFNSIRLKPVTYFSLKELESHLEKQLYHLFGERVSQDFSKKGRDTLECFFICCKPEFIERFIELSNGNDFVRKSFNEKNILPKRLTSIK